MKACNTLPAALLAEEPAVGDGRRVIFVSGDDTGANSEAARLVEALGSNAIQLGRLDEGGRLQQFGGALMVHNLTRRG